MAGCRIYFFYHMVKLNSGSGIASSHGVQKTNKVAQLIERNVNYSRSFLFSHFF